MRRPDLSDVALLLGTLIALHAIYRWSPPLAELSAGILLAVWGATVGVLKTTKTTKKRST